MSGGFERPRLQALKNVEPFLYILFSREAEVECSPGVSPGTSGTRASPEGAKEQFSRTHFEARGKNTQENAAH